MYEVKRRQGQIFLGFGTYTATAEWVAASDYDALLADRNRLATALRQIYTGAAEPADGLTYSEIAAIADKALRAAE